jgi:hypothetical protein
MQQDGKARERPARGKASKAKPAKASPESLAQRVRRLLGRLRIVRNGVNLHIVFAATQPEPVKAVTVDDPVTAELRQMGRELGQRLDRHALSRTVFLHLAIVERELRRYGYPALQSLPVELLHAALGQLKLVVGREPGELGTLRAKMLDAILARQPQAGDFGSNLALSVFDAPHKLQVVEGGESAFFHAEQEWARLDARPSAPGALPTSVDTPEGAAQRGVR